MLRRVVISLFVMGGLACAAPKTVAPMNVSPIEPGPNERVNVSHVYVVVDASSSVVEEFPGVKALTQSVNGPLADGPIDSWDIRLNQGDETARAPLSSAPPAYRAAAEEAVDRESVPRAYRDQVKQYFDLDKE